MECVKKHILPRQFNIKHKFMYDKSDFWKYTKPYHNSLKFYWLLIRAIIKKQLILDKLCVK